MSGVGRGAEELGVEESSDGLAHLEGDGEFVGHGDGILGGVNEVNEGQG